MLCLNADKYSLSLSVFKAIEKLADVHISTCFSIFTLPMDLIVFKETLVCVSFGKSDETFNLNIIGIDTFKNWCFLVRVPINLSRAKTISQTRWGMTQKESIYLSLAFPLAFHKLADVFKSRIFPSIYTTPFLQVLDPRALVDVSIEINHFPLTAFGAINKMTNVNRSIVPLHVAFKKMDKRSSKRIYDTLHFYNQLQIHAQVYCIDFCLCKAFKSASVIDIFSCWQYSFFEERVSHVLFSFLISLMWFRTLSMSLTTSEHASVEMPIKGVVFFERQEPKSIGLLLGLGLSSDECVACLRHFGLIIPTSVAQFPFIVVPILH